MSAEYTQPRLQVLRLQGSKKMQNNSITKKNNYANIRAISHDISDLEKIMESRNKTEIRILKSVNDLASMSYSDVIKQQSKWLRIKNLSLILSFMLLVITMFLMYTSPILTQTQYGYDDARVYGVGVYLAIGAILMAIVLDVGRSYILDKSNNGGFAWTQYIVFTLTSIIFSTVGMLAIANFYASSNQTDTNKSIDTARQYMIDHASMAGVTMSSLDSQQSAFDKKFYTKGSGYKRRAHLRDTARIDAERTELKAYLSAKGTVNGKQNLLANTDSSNWLYNSFATIIKQPVALAGLILGILINLISELMAMVAHSRLIKLNARIELTNSQWNSAVMASDRATIVNSSNLQLVAGLDTFQHVFAMPFSVLNKYQNSGTTLGDFQKNGDDVIDIEVSSTNQAGSDLERKYNIAFSADAGSQINCPVCSTNIKKKTFNHVFCSSTGKGNCKDDYHNILNPDRISARKQ